jgi:dsRNA-specific ribonuclease
MADPLLLRVRQSLFHTDLQDRNEVDLLSWESSSSGPSHTAQWTVVCKSASKVVAIKCFNRICGRIVDGVVKGTGIGGKKKEAKEKAALQALGALGVTG